MDVNKSTETFTGKLRLAVRQLRNLPRVLQLVWVATPRWSVLWAIGLVVLAIPPVVTVYLTRWLVDQLAGMDRSAGNLLPVLTPAALIIGILLLAEVLRSVFDYVASVQATLLQDHVHSLVHAQAARVDVSFYDSPEFFDHLHRAQSEASYRPAALLLSLGGLLQQGITLFAMCGILVQFGIAIPLVLVLTTIPSFWVLLRFTYRQHQWRRNTTSTERRANYFSYLLTARECVSELRQFGLGPAFRSMFDDIRHQLRTGEWKLAREHMAAKCGAAVAAILLGGLVTLWMIWRAQSTSMTLGDLALFYQAFSQGQRMMHALFQQVGQVYYNSLFAGDLFEYLALDPTIVSPPEPQPCPPAVTKDIRFENVTFHYPQCETPVLRNLELRMPAGKITALVGLNGAGKSTIVKLLLRLYDPTSGRITLDGVDLRDLPLDEYRQRITVIFQEPIPFNMTMRENLAWGVYPRPPSDAELAEASRLAGLDELIAELPNGYEQLLGRAFLEGEELSVGQWQKVALGRAFLRRAPVIILDEPTSAMDPWSEAKWLQGFRALAATRTALIITHRFSTAMHADEIHVIEHGQIVESGSHASLLASGGPYAVGFAAQMQGARPRL